MNETEKIIQAFPRALREDVLSLLGKVGLRGEAHAHTFEVRLDGERLAIPSRIYFEEPQGWRLWRLNQTESLILDCLFTRHHNGYVRQSRLEQMLLSDAYWTTPFAVQLLGEYVMEILVTLENGLSERRIENFVRFVKENPEHFETTKSRVVSYWNCYYRARFPNKDDYVGFRILAKISPFTASKRAPQTPGRLHNSSHNFADS